MYISKSDRWSIIGYKFQTVTSLRISLPCRFRAPVWEVNWLISLISRTTGILDVVKFLKNRWKNNWDLHFLLDLREAADINSCLMFLFNYFKVWPSKVKLIWFNQFNWLINVRIFTAVWRTGIVIWVFNTNSSFFSCRLAYYSAHFC